MFFFHDDDVHFQFSPSFCCANKCSWSVWLNLKKDLRWLANANIKRSKKGMKIAATNHVSTILLTEPESSRFFHINL